MEEKVQLVCQTYKPGRLSTWSQCCFFTPTFPASGSCDQYEPVDDDCPTCYVLKQFSWADLCHLVGSSQEFSSKNKLLITGTPLQNNIEELW